MRKPIFKFTFLNFFFLITIITNLKSADILKEYNLNKKSLKENSILETQKYLYSIAVSKKNDIQDISIKKNRLIAEVKLLDRIKNNVNWPSKFPPYLKEAIWKFYKSKKKYKLEGITLIDKGEIGDNYFVVVGVKKENVDKFKITYNLIKKELE